MKAHSPILRSGSAAGDGDYTISFAENQACGVQLGVPPAGQRTSVNNGTTAFAGLSITVEGKIMSFAGPRVMAILNLTPDSFYDGGRLTTDAQLLKAAEKHLTEGADILDVGGHSSRPGSSVVSAEEEIGRVVTSMRLLRKNFPQAILSIDTFRTPVAKAACEEGASIVNDVSGGNTDNTMLPWVAENRMPYVLTHASGHFAAMHRAVTYEDLVREVFQTLQKKVAWLRAAGAQDIIVDVGFGFSKNVSQNYRLLDNLSFFGALQLPVLVGISRKSMIYKPLAITPAEALVGTAALHMIALQQGASLLRVHDVKPATQVIALYKQLLSSRSHQE